MLVATTMAWMAIGLGQSQPSPIEIGKGTVVSKGLIGNGIQWDPYDYPLNEYQWKQTEDRVDKMRLGFIRLNVDHSFYHRGLDASGQPIYVWKDGSTNGRLRDVERILKFAQARKIKVILGQWGPPGPVSGVKLGVDEPRSVQMYAAFVKHFRERFSCIRFANYINEPNGDWSGNTNYETWARAIKMLRLELNRLGLQDVAVIGPDATGNTEWREPLTWLPRSAKELGAYIGAFDMHWYALEPEVRTGAIEKTLVEMKTTTQRIDGQAGKQFFLGEAGILSGKTNGDQQPRVKTFEYALLMADYLSQVYRSGWLGAIGWDLDDAMHVNEGPATQPPGPKTLKVWGMWNSQGSAMGNPADEKTRPWYDVWKWSSRLFSPGSTAYRVDGAPPGVRIVGGSQGGKEIQNWMIVNLSDEPVEINLPKGRGDIYRVELNGKTVPGFTNTVRPDVLKPSASFLVWSKTVVFLSTSPKPFLNP